MHSFFQHTFKGAHAPVIVCQWAPPHAVTYANASARLLLKSRYVAEKPKENAGAENLADLLRPLRLEMLDGLLEALTRMGVINGYPLDTLPHEDGPVRLSITANAAKIKGEKYMILYPTAQGGGVDAEEICAMVETIFGIASACERPDDAINRVIAYAGSCVRASRVYIFEEDAKATAGSTYAWRAPGAAPAMQDLKALRKYACGDGAGIAGGMFITDDAPGLPEEDKAMLEAQGIKSLAIMPLVHEGQPLGSIGFDDCERARAWGETELRLIRHTANLVTCLLVRRNAERPLSLSRDILQTVSDSIDYVIYANDIHTHEIVFLNETMAKALGRPAEAVLGGKCWAHLQRGMKGPCDFCPIPKMIKQGYLERSDTYTWDFQNTINGKWYQVKDVFVKWIDGRDVHIETATEITHQKEYEEQLMYYASVDSLTGVFNREWGYKMMEEMTHLPCTPGNDISLVFIDLDGLKIVNDTYGHDAGDRFISGVISVLRANKRKSDIICRWGGDEFVLLLKCDAVAAKRVMKNLENKLTEYNHSSGEPFVLSFSYGITGFDKGPGASIGDIITRADRIMYEHKYGKGERRPVQ